MTADLIAKQEAKKFTIAKEDKNKALTVQSATMAWNNQTMRPNISYDDAFKGMLALADYYQKQATGAVKAKDEALQAAATSDKEKGDFKKDYEKRLADLTAANLADRAKADQDNADVRTQLKDALQKVADAASDKADAVKKEHAVVLARGHDQATDGPAERPERPDRVGAAEDAGERRWRANRSRRTGKSSKWTVRASSRSSTLARRRASVRG